MPQHFRAVALDYDGTLTSTGRLDDTILDVCLYHVGKAKEGIDGVYNKALYLDEKREALQKWADYLENITSSPVTLRDAA